MRAWIDRTNDGLSGMPADGISLPLKKGDFGTSRWVGSKIRLHQPRGWAEGGIARAATGETADHRVPSRGFQNVRVRPGAHMTRAGHGQILTEA